jgi:mRNA deadenylase 3'-5' endonuclease subunit Ccr4
MTVTEDWYPQTNPKHLEAEYRRNLLKQYLKPYIDQEYILCLQEVSTKDWKVFKPFFEKNNYCYLHQTISSGSSRLGLSICYPHKYKLCSSHIVRVGGEIEKAISNVICHEELPDSYIDKRQVIMVELQIGSSKVFVATYHMPCRFLQQTLMEAHALFCMKIINDIACNSPVIFTGDFNSKYGEDVYKILTSNNCNSTFYQTVCSLFPECLNYFNDSLSKSIPRLPTCYDQKDGNVYILDYIFYRNIQFVSSDLVQHDFPIPNETYASDHLPIIATFCL